MSDAVRIPLRARDGSIRAYALVDAADAEFVNQWRWSLSKGYAARGERVGNKVRHFRMHRELLGLRRGDAMDGDHINRDRLDNRRSNLRSLPKGANAQNQSSNAGSSSRHRGVSWDTGTGKWRAYVGSNGKTTFLGLFTEEREAAVVARAARLAMLPYTIEREAVAS